MAAFVLMRAELVCCGAVLAALMFALPVAAQGTDFPVIDSPTAGQVLEGQVTITGTTDIPNFASAELAFAYTSDPTNTWFVLLTTVQPVAKDVLATWDTTSISDGDYTLRLRVNLLDGSFQDATVAVQVRNYSAETTPAPAPTPTESALQIPPPILLAPSPTPTMPPLPTPTPLPPNPAAVTTDEVYVNLQRGALAIGLLFLVFALILRLRRS